MELRSIRRFELRQVHVRIEKAAKEQDTATNTAVNRDIDSW